MSEPLTAEEETRWRALLDADTSPMPSWSRESMLRIWATLDAARTPPQPDLREAVVAEARIVLSNWNRVGAMNDGYRSLHAAIAALDSQLLAKVESSAASQPAPADPYRCPDCGTDDPHDHAAPCARGLTEPAPADEVGTCDTYHGPEVECSWCRKYRPSLSAGPAEELK